MRSAAQQPGAIRPVVWLLGLLVAGHGHGAGRADTGTALGAAIFHGQESVAVAPATAGARLPGRLTACVQCHSAPAARAADGAPSPLLETKFAPVLSADWLLQARSRRNGPPFAFDRAGFCTTVRTGIDPRAIVMRRSMPRFAWTDAQCHAVWTYLTSG